MFKVEHVAIFPLFYFVKYVFYRLLTVVNVFVPQTPGRSGAAHKQPMKTYQNLDRNLYLLNVDTASKPCVETSRFSRRLENPFSTQVFESGVFLRSISFQSSVELTCVVSVFISFALPCPVPGVNALVGRW